MTYLIPDSSNFIYFSLTNSKPYDPNQKYGNLTNWDKNFLRSIISTFKFTKSQLSSQDAVDRVKKLEEVGKWLLLFNQPGGESIKSGTSIVEVDHQTSVTYVVHVYELVNNHASTFGWYDVDIKTGIITKEF